MATVEQRFASDHPAAEGHFPGNPIIPGAVLLSETLRAIAASLNMTLSPCRVRRAKFPRPARPGDRVVIEFSRSGASSVRFACAVQGHTVLVGEVQCCASSAT